MNYALIKDNVVVNLIWLNPSNKEEFPGAVACGDFPVGIGDSYDGTYFYRNGERLLTTVENMQNIIAELDKALIDVQYQLLTGGL